MHFRFRDNKLIKILLKWSGQICVLKGQLSRHLSTQTINWKVLCSTACIPMFNPKQSNNLLGQIMWPWTRVSTLSEQHSIHCFHLERAAATQEWKATYLMFDNLKQLTDSLHSKKSAQGTKQNQKHCYYFDTESVQFYLTKDTNANKYCNLIVWNTHILWAIRQQ